MRPAAFRRVLGVAALAALAGCGTVVERIPPESMHDLSGGWNDTDSRLASQQMVREVRAWIETYRLVNRRPPVLAMGAVRDLTGEGISVAAIAGDIERELVASRRATLVAMGEERRGVREERRDQDYHATEATRNAPGQERGADFLLTGTISAIVDRADNREVRFYQVDLALIDLADSSKAWIGQTKIKKAIRRPLIDDGALPEPQPRAGQQFASRAVPDETGRASRLTRWECTKPSPYLSCY